MIFKNVYLKLNFNLSSSYTQVICLEPIVSVACFKEFQRWKMPFFLFEYCIIDISVGRESLDHDVSSELYILLLYSDLETDHLENHLVLSASLGYC